MSKEKNITVYIAGPITNDPDYKRKFDAVEECLKKQGYEVWNPAVEPAGKNYREYINAGLSRLMFCDAICMLPGWSQSKGASLEHYYAATTGMQIMQAAEFDAGLWWAGTVIPSEQPSHHEKHF